MWARCIATLATGAVAMQSPEWAPDQLPTVAAASLLRAWRRRAGHTPALMGSR